MTKTYLHIDPKTNSIGILHENMQSERPPKLFRDLFKELAVNKESVLIEVAAVTVMTQEETLEFLKNKPNEKKENNNETT
jgi:hypothetical protein